MTAFFNDYIDSENGEEKFISVPEQGGGKLIPEGPMNPGIIHTIARGSNGHLGLYRIETQVTQGNGSARFSGLGSNSAARESMRVAFDYFKANARRISTSPKAGDHNYHIHVIELHNSGSSDGLTLASVIALASALMQKSVQSQIVALGGMSLGGNIIPMESLSEAMSVALDAGAKRVLLPTSSVGDISTIPGELFAKFQTGFYADPIDAVFKAFGVD